MTLWVFSIAIEKKLMKNLIMSFLTLYINKNKFMNFHLYRFCIQNYLHIFAILTYFVKIWTLNGYTEKLWLTIFDCFYYNKKNL